MTATTANTVTTSPIANHAQNSLIGTCPNCGYCPWCGRKNTWYPSYPFQYPTQLYCGGQTVPTTSGQVFINNAVPDGTQFTFTVNTEGATCVH